MKTEPQGEGADNEVRAMEWPADKIHVPKILCKERENGVSYLLMSTVCGRRARSDEFPDGPEARADSLAGE